MRVVPAQIETVEEIYGVVWTAVANRRPIEAMYQIKAGLDCFVRIGWVGIGKGDLACSAISTVGEKPERTPPDGFTGQLALCGAGETQPGEVGRRLVAHRAKSC